MIKMISDCMFKRLNHVAINEGALISSYERFSSGECRNKCDKTEMCFNVRICPNSRTCSLFKNKLIGLEVQTKLRGIEESCYTAYKQCKH